jgi:hypothetical protein
MKRKLGFRWRRPIAWALVVFVLLTGVTQAQTGGGYDLTWNTVNSGYMFSTGGGYSLGGTTGQAGAGTLTGGVYTLSGGFWNNPPEYGHKTYLPLIVKH